MLARILYPNALTKRFALIEIKSGHTSRKFNLPTVN